MTVNARLSRDGVAAMAGSLEAAGSGAVSAA